MMGDLRAIKTLRQEIDESVLAQFEKLRQHVETGNVAGLSVALTFRDGKSLTFSSGCDSRREMLGLMVDALIDYASHSPRSNAE